MVGIYWSLMCAAAAGAIVHGFVSAGIIQPNLSGFIFAVGVGIWSAALATGASK